MDGALPAPTDEAGYGRGRRTGQSLNLPARVDEVDLSSGVWILGDDVRSEDVVVEVELVCKPDSGQGQTGSRCF